MSSAASRPRPPTLGRVGETIRPAPRHEDAFRATPLPRPPSFNEADVSDKPAAIRNLTTIPPARINGIADARLLVDTGSTWTVLSPKLASQLELPISANTRRNILVLAGGREVAVPRVRVASVKLGAVAVENLYIGVYELFPTVPEIQGVVGMDFLRHFRVSIDQRQPRLVLSPLTN